MKGKSRIEIWHSHKLKPTFRCQLISVLVYVCMCVYICQLSQKCFNVLDPKGKNPNGPLAKLKTFVLTWCQRAPHNAYSSFLLSQEPLDLFLPQSSTLFRMCCSMYLMGKKSIVNLSFLYFIHEEWLESLMENISIKNVSSSRLQVCSFQLPKRLTKDIYATKEACVKSHRLQNTSLAMSESHSTRKSCLLISGKLNRF